MSSCSLMVLCSSLLKHCHLSSLQSAPLYLVCVMVLVNSILAFHASTTGALLSDDAARSIGISSFTHHFLFLRYALYILAVSGCGLGTYLPNIMEAPLIRC